jgi:alanine racemase
MADVSHVSGVEVGDEVVLIGRQAGEEILAAEVAERAGTIAWEVFTGIGSRVRRVYL